MVHPSHHDERRIARNDERKEIINYDNLSELFRACNAATLELTLDSIIAEVNRFRGKADLCDDIVLLGFEFLGS